MFTACKSWRNIHCNERCKANEEIENGKYALEVLGGELKEMSTFQLPFEESERNILLIEKSARHQRNIHANREHPINYLLKNKSY